MFTVVALEVQTVELNVIVPDVFSLVHQAPHHFNNYAYFISMT